MTDDELESEVSPDLGLLTVKARAFLAAYRTCGVLTQAAAHAGIGLRSHYYWLEKSEPYKREFRLAAIEAADNVEAEVRRRAMFGTRRYKFTPAGQPILKPGVSADDPDPWYYELDYSDRLLEILMRAKRPDEFGHKVSSEISGPNGGPLEVSHSLRQIALLNEEICDTITDALEHAANAGTNAGTDSDGFSGGVCVDGE